MIEAQQTVVVVLYFFSILINFSIIIFVKCLEILLYEVMYIYRSSAFVGYAQKHLTKSLSLKIQRERPLRIKLRLEHSVQNIPAKTCISAHLEQQWNMPKSCASLSPFLLITSN